MHQVRKENGKTRRKRSELVKICTKRAREIKGHKRGWSNGCLSVVVLLVSWPRRKEIIKKE